MRERPSPAGPRSVPGRERVGAAIAMGTRDDEYDYLFKGACSTGPQPPHRAGLCRDQRAARARGVRRGLGARGGLVGPRPGLVPGEPRGRVGRAARASPPRPVPVRVGRAPAPGRLRSPGATGSGRGAGRGCAGGCPEIAWCRAGVQNHRLWWRLLRRSLLSAGSGSLRP